MRTAINWGGAAWLAAGVTVSAQSVRAQEVAPVVRRVVVVGTKGLDAEKVADAARTVSLGKPGDGATLQAVASAVAALYRRNGFSIAQVVATNLSPDGTLTLTVAEGTIRNLVIRGNTRTSGNVIRRVVSLAPGDTYREDAVRDARNRLSRLGIFDEVIVIGALETDEDKAKAAEESGAKTEGTGDKPVETDTKSEEAAPVPDEVGFVDLIVRVKERRTGNVAATFGYAEGTGLLGFVDFSEANVAGTANRASIQWQRTNTARFDNNGFFVPGQTRSAYLVSYDVPALGTRDTAFGGEVYDTNTVILPYFQNNRDNIRNYELRRGGKARFGRAFGKTATAFITARRDEVGYDTLPNQLAPPPSVLQNADAIVAALGVSLALDGRDDALNPRRGFFHNFSYERSGRFVGGTTNFAGLTADLRGYAPLNSSKASPVLALRFLGGAVGDNAPLSEQYFIGGYDLLRGYDLFSIRGTRLLLTSAEVRVPLGPGFQGVVFTDIGNAYLPGQSAGLGNVRGSGGLGLRFLTPIGPIRIDAAYGNRLQTYVSLGQSF
ncbi:MAG: BamA/TamA family outer membrane protein [Armatimonadetes bacterium]|nr:BamA/TamA family outer membrane protein [Armatimonadota bacterium]